MSENGNGTLPTGTFICEKTDEAGRLKTETRIEYDGPISAEVLEWFIRIAKETVL